MELKKAFKRYCKEKGMRYTPERDIILEEISFMRGHFDVDSLFLNIRKKHPQVKLAKGSVYRALPYLLDAGLVRESLSQNGHVCYEKGLGYQQHGHLKCVRCGKITEFIDSRVEGVQEDVCKKNKFKLTNSVYVINGYCKDCLDKE